MLLVALSCLQGRTQSEAFAELARLPVDGIQLTPGNLPSANFRELTCGYRGELRYHHSFSWQHYRAEVYGASGRTPKLPRAWSVHPPLAKHPVAFGDWLNGALEVDALCEIGQIHRPEWEDRWDVLENEGIISREQDRSRLA